MKNQASLTVRDGMTSLFSLERLSMTEGKRETRPNTGFLYPEYMNHLIAADLEARYNINV